MELRKRYYPPTKQGDQNGVVKRAVQQSSSPIGFLNFTLSNAFSSLFIILSLFVFFSFLHPIPTFGRLSPFADARVLDLPSHLGNYFLGNCGRFNSLMNYFPANGFHHGSTKQCIFARVVGSQNISTQPNIVSDAKLLGGLLPSGFDEASCLSRYQSFMYRKVSPFKPSSYLLSKLRNYEELHKRCGPGTLPYNEALKQLNSGSPTAIPTECNYVVWISHSGLGNRILTVASAFLYALLTSRVLLIDPGADMTDLFCEPFPSTSWFLPEDFPVKSQLKSFDQKSPQCHGHMLRNNLLNTSSEVVPPYLYLHLDHDYNDLDKLFFCDDDQTVLSKVPWLLMRTDNYFVPSLYLIPSFEQELFRLFPEKVTIFHHLGRYLFHPTNQVWGLITRYYNAYLARADERIGIQIRTFEDGPGPFPHVQEQLTSCLLKEKLLPEVNTNDSSFTPSKNQKTIAVLTTSLISDYHESLRLMYWEHPTVTGDLVGFHQPSHEGFQQTHKKTHNRKAWAEMYLLSLSDKLVTSGWSTFGYVAQGLGGLKPWILYKPEKKTTPNPPCGRAMSIEPCFHAPPLWDCKAKRGTDTGIIVPHVRHCEDITWGLKVVEGGEEV